MAHKASGSLVGSEVGEMYTGFRKRDLWEKEDK
jgi:hypothetical protein